MGSGVQAVYAQNASRPEESSGLAEVIVTAERHTQSVQKAAFTIQVLSADEIRNAGISGAADLEKLVAGVEIGMGGANSQIFIRGVGGADFSPLSSPGVAFNVDGVYVGRPDGINGNFYDIARVEVLKGPQGTLYGRNANGGSINVITNDAKLGNTNGYVDVEAGNFGLLRSSGAANFSVSENSALRAAFNVVSREGYLSDGSNDDVEQSARLRYLWRPATASDVTLRLNADYTHLGGRGGDYTYLPRVPGATAYLGETDPLANAYLHSAIPLGPLLDDLVRSIGQDTTLANFSAQLDWDLGPAMLTVLPAYRYLDSNYATHIAALYESHNVTRQQSLEIRLGHSTPQFTWVAGGYFFDEQAPGGTVVVRASDILQNYLIGYSPATRSYAGFGQATVAVVPHVRLIGGARFTHENRDVTGSIKNAAVNPPALLEDYGGQKTFKAWTYKLGVEIDLAADSLLYLTNSKGYKAGGFSQTVAPLNVYEPETLQSFELGLRSRFLDNRLQVNLGAYHWQYTDLQDQRVNIDPLGNVNFITFNSGDAKIYGGTLDIVAKLSTHDTLSLSAEYAHSQYDRYFFQTPAPFFLPGSSGCPISGPYAPGATLPYSANGSNVNRGPLPVVVGDCSGFEVGRLPAWTGLLAYGREQSLPNGDSLAFNARLKYKSGHWLGIDFIPSERQKAYSVLDADLTYSFSNNGWSVGAYGRNLTNTLYYTGGIQAAFVGGLFNANIGAPRTYGVQAHLAFGH